MTHFLKLFSRNPLSIQTFNKALCASSLTAAVLGFSVSPSFAQLGNHDDVVVTAGSLRVSSGGSQDIKHFRGAIESGHVPTSRGMTSEGLLSEHDLYLTSDEPCVQVLCLNSAATSARFVDADYFAGLGFDTNISEDWARDPLNLVAVIDRSGSMRNSIENVKHSLREISDQLRDGDQISFVLYGSDVVTHLEPIAMNAAAKKTIAAKIETILVEGSTNMDAGLARGYDIAYQTKANFSGTTRVMIFTDERPNTGRTDADGFMARARRASQNGIGLTTIGYGVDYGGELGAKIASVRGGNLFYVGTPEHVETLFNTEFDFMVSEVANDMTVKLTPAPGLEIADVFGVPAHMISAKDDGSTVLTVPSVFMSSNAGGLFMSLKGEPMSLASNLFEAELNYTQGAAVRSSRLKTDLSVRPAANLVKAEVLSAQYKAMKGATEAYHVGKFDEAYEIFSPFAAKFTAEKIEGLEEEYDLVTALNRTIAIDAGQIEGLENPPKYAKLIGAWEVSRAKNMLDVNKGDRFYFTKDSIEHFRKKLGYDEAYLKESYQVNEKQIYLSESDMTFRFSINKKGKLWLRHRDQETVIHLRPYVPTEAASPS